MEKIIAQSRTLQIMNRRQVLQFLGSIAAFGACADDKGTNPDDNAPDIILEGNEDELARLVKGQFSALQSMAQNPGEELRIGLLSDAGMEVVQMSFSDSGPVAYRHPVLVRESDGMRSHLLFGRDGLRPSILFADEQGNPLMQDGQELEFALGGDGAGKLARYSSGTTAFDASEWLWTGIKVLAAGLAVWIGASIVKLVFAALAFLGFNAMVLGLLMTAVAVLPGLISWLLDLTGWEVADVRAFFERRVEEIVLLWDEVVVWMEGYGL